MKNVTKLLAFFCLIPLICCQNIEQKVKKPYVLQIKMKETECMKCINGQLLLKDFAEVAEMNIVFNGLNDKEINRFLDVNSMDYLKNIDDCEIVSDKKTFTSISSNQMFSEGYLYDRQGKQLMHFYFRLDEPTMNHLKTMIKAGKYLMQEGKAIKINNDYGNSPVTFSFQKGKFSLVNTSMNLVQVFDISGSLFYAVDGTNLNVLDIFTEMTPKDSLQLTAINYLKDHGMLQPIPKDVFINGETLLVGFDMPYLDMDGIQFGLRSYYTLLSFEPGDNKQSYVILCNGKNEKINKIVFDTEDSGISAIIIKRDESSGTYSLSFNRFSLSNGILSVMHTKPINYPEFEREHNYSYEPKIKCGLLNLRGTDFFYNVKSDTLINLPFSCNIKVKQLSDYDFEVKYDSFLADWHSDGTEIGIIFKDIKSDKWYHELLSMKGEILDKTELFPNECNIRQYYMTSPRTALCLTNENTIRTCVFGNYSDYQWVQKSVIIKATNNMDYSK